MFAPLENGRKFSRRLHGWQNTEDSAAARVAKMYGQQKRNIIHMSSTAYEQDHSAAAPPSSVAGTSRPSALAVLRLITSSNLVGCWMGNARSKGFRCDTQAQDVYRGSDQAHAIYRDWLDLSAASAS
jgi:hypothetical protein